MPMNICINYGYFSDMSTDNICSIYCSKHIFCHPGYLYDTTKGIGTTLQRHLAILPQVISLLPHWCWWRASFVMPLKSSTCCPNLSGQRDSVLLTSSKRVWWEFLNGSQNSSSRTVSLRQLCSVKYVYFLEYALFQMISILLSNISWPNCLWSFKITYRSKSHTKHFGLEMYRPRTRYTMCAIHPSFISFSDMKCLQQFTRSKNSSLG